MTVSRRVFSGATYLFLGQGGARLLSILTVPILSHLLAPEGYGTAALITTALSLGAVFGVTGIDISYARFLGARHGPAGPAVESFCWRFALGSGLVWGVIAGLVWGRILPYWLPIPIEYAPIIGGGVFITTILALAQSRARLRGEFKRLAAVLFGAAVLGALGAIALATAGVRDERPLVAAAFITMIGGLLGLGVPPLTILRRPSGLSPGERRHIVQVGLYGVITAPAYWLLSSSDRWFLSSLAGADIAGIYSVSASIGIVGLIVSTAIFSAWLPEALREYESNPDEATRHLTILQRRIVLVLAVVWLSVAGLGDEVMRLLAAPPFHPGARNIPWLAGGIFFYGFFHLANAGLLIRKRANRVIGWWIAGGLISIVLNVTLIPRYGDLGAAVTQCVSFGIVGIGSLLSSRAVFHLPLGRPLCIGLVGIFGLSYPLIGTWLNAPLLSIALKLPVIGITAVIFALFVDPKLPATVIGLVRHRLTPHA